jgi:hypothetical protein
MQVGQPLTGRQHRRVDALVHVEKVGDGDL